MLGADDVAIGFSGGGNNNNTGDDQWEEVGSAICIMTKTYLPESQKIFTSCTIVQLDVNTGDSLTNMQAFAAILRRVQSLCIENAAEHLAMIGSESFRVSSGLPEHAGFTLCRCEYPSKNVSVGSQSQLCMDLPTRRTLSSVYKDQGHPVDSSYTRVRDYVLALANRTQPITKPTNTGATPNRTEGPFAKKEYCMHWIFRGECAYMQGGCKFKHEIPLDKETRASIGMAGIPQWFKQSPYWDAWLQQVDRAERLEPTRDGHHNALFLAQQSGGPSDTRAKNISSRGEGKAIPKRRGRGNFGVYMDKSLSQNPNQDTVASKITAEGSRVGSASATAVDSTNAINNKTAKRRRNRQRHKHPRALEPSVAEKREDRGTDEGSDVLGSDGGVKIRGQAKRPMLDFQHQ